MRRMDAPGTTINTIQARTSTTIATAIGRGIDMCQSPQRKQGFHCLRYRFEYQSNRPVGGPLPARPATAGRPTQWPESRLRGKSDGRRWPDGELPNPSADTERYDPPFRGWISCVAPEPAVLPREPCLRVLAPP